MAQQSLTNGQRYSRPLAKCVDIQHIREWIPEAARRRIEVPTAWAIIKTHYCAALVGRGVCPIECSNCRETLVSMFGLEEAKNPEALLTWRAKDRSAKRIEELIAAQKHEEAQHSRMEFPPLETCNGSSADPNPLASLFPKKKVDNLFLEMEKDYE